MDKNYIQRLRRFALTIGLILLTYSIASVELNTQKEISPLGLPLNIKNPNLISIALVLASLYASFRYLYYAVLIGPAPHTTRNRLRKAILPDGTKFEDKLSDANYYLDFRLKLHAAIYKSFPMIGNYEAALVDLSTSPAKGPVVEMKVPAMVGLFCIFENIDYYSPIWVNVMALSIFVVKNIK